ncbi:MAG TPA: dienelactone hydrolase family protein [Silvibacterium sp.]|nr:dienelactone hydrolase family protein [Silvibacterium sp.]
MSEQVRLTAADGHEFEAYVAKPHGEPVAGLVVVQEIYGVNQHIRSVADSYAHDGFLAVAPALFDRYERGVDLGYEGADAQKARSFPSRLDIGAAVRDTAAALDYARIQTGKKSGVIGYCLGGTIAWLAATRLNPDAAVGYYGGNIAKFAGEKPTCPVMLHFGRKDQHIPREEVDKISAAHPEVDIYWYDAGHGFNCDARSSFEPDSAKLARERSLEFLTKNLS